MIKFLPMQSNNDDHAQDLLTIVNRKKEVVRDAEIVLKRARADMLNAYHDYACHLWCVEPGDLIVRPEDRRVFRIVAFYYLDDTTPENRPYVYAQLRRADGGFDVELISMNGNEWESYKGD